jgi:hypothetical protein
MITDLYLDDISNFVGNYEGYPFTEEDLLGDDPRTPYLVELEIYATIASEMLDDLVKEIKELRSKHPPWFIA